MRSLEPPAFLQDLLTDGPRPSVEIRAAAKAAGIGWRSVERAAKALGVMARKAGRVWEWSLPGGNSAKLEDRQRKTVRPASGEVRQPANPPAVAADLDAVLNSLVTRIERLEVVLAPRLVPEPAPSAGARPAWDHRKVGERGARPGRWGPGGAVQCADCRHVDSISSDGRCVTGNRVVKWAWAKRQCDSFEHWRSTPCARL